MTLEDHIVENAQPLDRPHFLWDENVRGFGVKINPAGTKAFVLQFRLNGGDSLPARVTIGKFGDMTTATARQIAASLKADIARGIDPRATLSSTGKAQRRPRPRSERRTGSRDDATIVAAARRVFLDHGYGASLDDVALAAGVSRQTIYTRYRSKEELLRLVVENIIENQTAMPALDVRKPLRDNLLAFGSAYLRLCLEPDGIAVYRLVAFDLREFPDLGSAIYQISRRNISTPLTTYFAHKIAEGEMVAVLPGRLAEHFLGAILGHARDFAMFGIANDDPPDESAVAQILDVFLHGIVRAN